MADRKEITVTCAICGATVSRSNISRHRRQWHAEVGTSTPRNTSADSRSSSLHRSSSSMSQTRLPWPTYEPIASAYLQQAAVSMLSLHKHLTETNSMQHLMDKFPDIAASQRHSLMIGAITGAQVAAKLFVVVERDRVSPDPLLRTRAINAGSALSHFVLGLTSECEFEQMTMPVYNGDTEGPNDSTPVPTLPTDLANLVLPVSMEQSNHDCDMVVAAAIAAGIPVQIHSATASNGDRSGSESAGNSRAIIMRHPVTEHGDDQSTTGQPLTSAEESSSSVVQATPHDVDGSMVSHQKSLPAESTAARKHQTEDMDRPRVNSKDRSASQERSPYVPASKGSESNIAYQPTSIKELEKRKRDNQLPRLHHEKHDKETTPGDLGTEPECSVDLSNSRSPSTSRSRTMRSPRLSKTTYWRYRRPINRERLPRRYSPYRRNNQPPTRQISVTLEEFERLQASRNRHNSR